MAQTAAEKKAAATVTSNLVKNGEVKMTTTETVETEVQDSEAKPKGVARKHFPAVTAYGKTAEEIAAAINDGRIVNVGETAVTIRAKKGSGGKDEFVTYEKLMAQNKEGEVFFCGGKDAVATKAPETGDDTRTEEQKAKGSADHFNYGFDLEIKRWLRDQLADILEGPANAIKKAAIAALENGIGGVETMEEAVAMVKASRIKKGLPV